MVTILDVLRLCWPGRGWSVDFTEPPTITAAVEGEIPTLDEIEAKRAEAEALMPAAVKIWPNAESFMDEFTLPEMAAISLSAHPTIAALRLLLSTWRSAVHADDARVIMGLDALEVEGIISPQRRAQILALPTA